MKSIEHLGQQLGSMNDLQTLVRTMKALSAASIVQYERSVDATAGYVQTVESGLQAALRHMPPHAMTASSHRTAAVIFGSDHGLCGRFNENVVTYALERLRPIEGRRLLVVGERVESDLAAKGIPIERVFRVPSSVGQITRTVQMILISIEALQAEQGIGRVLLVHNRSVERRVVPSIDTLLPLSSSRMQTLVHRRWPSRRTPQVFGDPGRLLRQMLRQLFVVSIFRACAESLASEHASRLAAMQAAERSLGERVEELRSRLRWARQNAITAELLDITSGFEATTEAAHA